MREIETEGGPQEVRGLTVGEIDELSKDYPITRWGCNLDDLGEDAATNEMFESILIAGTIKSPDFDFKQLTPRDERALFFGILAETYGDKDEEKNSLRSGHSTQTATD